MTFPQTLTATEANKETPIGEMFVSLTWAALLSHNPDTTTGLTFGVNGGQMLVDGVLTTVADQTTLLAASSTNYVEATRAGTISDNASGFTAGRIPLYVVTTSGSGVSSFVDSRAWHDLPGVAQRLSLSVAGGADVTLTAAQARNEILNFTGLLTGSINVIVPDGPQIWTVTNNTTGAFTLTVKTAAGSGVAVTQTKALDVAADGTNVIATNNDAAGVGSGTVTSLTASNGARTSSGSAITTTGVIYGDSVTNAQTGTTYTVLTGDRGKLITLANAGAIAVTLPQAGGSFPDGWYCDVQCIGAGTITITPTTSTINGAATLVLTTGQSARIVSDGTNYRALTGGSVVSTPVLIQIACSDETTPLSTGTAKVTFRAPYAFTLTDVRASVTAAPTGGTLLTVDVNEAGASILSTKLTFDASEKTTTTATTPRVISDSAIADDAEITIDIDAVGSTIAGAGLKVTLIGTKP